MIASMVLQFGKKYGYFSNMSFCELFTNSAKYSIFPL
jgi:hypothetical protein